MSLQSPENQLAQLRTKYDNEVKKNSNLLKMNSNLMKENELYQNIFSILRRWSHSFMGQFRQDQKTLNQDEIDDSCIDIEEDGEEFVKSLAENIERKIHELLRYKEQGSQSQLRTQRDNTEQSIAPQAEELQCRDCQRWKEFYVKETRETQRIQKLFDESSLLSTQKQLSIAKLKDDVRKLLDDYLTLYKKQLGTMQTQHREKAIQIAESEKISNRETVRMKDAKSKEKKSGNSGSKPKKVATNNYPKEQNIFLKDKTGRNITKYSIQLNTLQSNCQKGTQTPASFIEPEFSEKINSILSSYSEISDSYEKENYLLKQKLRQFHQILTIYREKERNRILFK